jgi:hypothetical protein
MYPNQRRARARISDDSIMRDATMETRELHVSIIRTGVSPRCVSHVSAAKALTLSTSSTRVSRACPWNRTRREALYYGPLKDNVFALFQRKPDTIKCQETE